MAAAFLMMRRRTFSHGEVLTKVKAHNRENVLDGKTLLGVML